MNQEENPTLWKYLDLAKFISLLQTKSLYFCRGDKFDDPLEGSYPLKNQNDFGCNDDGDSSKKWKKNVAVSCWHESECESDAMWRIYTMKNQGVVIKTTWKKLEEALDSKAYLERVKYINFVNDRANIKIPSDVFEYKRKAFIHEQEVRAIRVKLSKHPIENGFPISAEPIEGNEIPENGWSIEIHLGEMIENVVLSPYSESWFMDVVKDLAKKYCLPVSMIKDSELKADPVYANI